MMLRLVFLLAAVASVCGGASAQDDICVPVAPGNPTIRCAIPLASDTLLYIENQGVARLFVDLNGFAFKLAVDHAEVARSENAFPIPATGPITINIGAYLRPENNVIEFTPQGPAGSGIPRIIIANVLVEGQSVAYAVEGLTSLPLRLDLLQSYPNPFASTTRLVYTIPEDRITGLPVRLVIYDMLGRIVRVLVDDRRYPGTFTAMWDGTLGSGAPAASGLYVAQFVAGGATSQSVKLLLVR